jgi:hypothetical protein
LKYTSEAVSSYTEIAAKVLNGASYLKICMAQITLPFAFIAAELKMSTI